MKFLASALVLGVVVALLVVGVVWQMQLQEIVDVSPAPTAEVREPPAAPLPLAPSPAATQEPTATPARKSSVTCTGCDTPPNVGVRVVPAASPAPKPASQTVRTMAGAVSQRLRYTPESYTVLSGKAAHPHELAREILSRQQLGHLTFRVRMPSVVYDIQGQEVAPGQYRVEPQDVTLEAPAEVRADFSIRYPVLSDAQFSFIRANKDYRLVYGLIKGVVDHELRHYRELVAYIAELGRMFATPLTEGFTVEAESRQAFESQANAHLSRVLEQRSEVLRARHATKQDAIDDPEKGPRISFVFEEEVDGAVPSPLIAEFHGVANFSFELPPGPVPRPVTPNIK